MKMKHKSFPLKIEIKDDDADPRTVEGWASTFGNKDSYSDIVMPGAFANSIKSRMPKMLYQHNSDQPVGVWTAAAETEQGLYVKGQLLDTALGNDVYKMLKAGAISDMSIGYSTLDSDYDPKTGIRALKEVELWEVSLVTFPANDQANITMVKSVTDDIDAATDMLEQAIALCQAYSAGGIDPTPEAFGTVMQLMQQSLEILGDPDDDDADEGKSKPETARKLERYLRDAGFTQKEAKGIVSEGFKAIAPQRDVEGQELKTICNLFNQFKL